MLHIKVPKLTTKNFFAKCFNFNFNFMLHIVISAFPQAIPSKKKVHNKAQFQHIIQTTFIFQKEGKKKNLIQLMDINRQPSNV